MQGRANVREFSLSSGIEEEGIEKACLQKIPGWIKGQSGEEPGPEGKVYEGKAHESEQDKGSCLTVCLKALCRRFFHKEAEQGGKDSQSGQCKGFHSEEGQEETRTADGVQKVVVVLKNKGFFQTLVLGIVDQDEDDEDRKGEGQAEEGACCAQDEYTVHKQPDSCMEQQQGPGVEVALCLWFPWTYQEVLGRKRARDPGTGCDKDKSKGMGQERHGKRAVSENGRMWSGM